ncbi:MAG TPA: bacillithiol biosynthesis deacetylase BshB1 [Cryomorphaceae bacterium]|nr:bacillithiol biosynthesis deacetylase BshB1 [Cryomorphaceae bacterium]
MMKLDILAIAAHPDDVELSCSGTIIKSIRQGKKVGILDLTKGELGTRGTAELRAEEAERASEIMGINVRENVGLPDGFLNNVKEQQLAIIPFIRKYRPDIVLANALADRHPDHGMAAALAAKSCFLSGLKAIPTKDENGNAQEAFRPRAVYHYNQDRFLQPDFVVDISDEWEQKVKSIQAFSSQFYSGKEDNEPVTPISTPEFMKFLESRARDYGRSIGVQFGEGFVADRTIGVRDLSDLL